MIEELEPIISEFSFASTPTFVEDSDAVCFRHAEPVFGSEHKCRQALIGHCPVCRDWKDLNQFFRCASCGTLPKRGAIRQKYTVRELCEEENGRNYLIRLDLHVGRGSINRGKLLLRKLLKALAAGSRAFAQEGATNA